jgi:hypothetical protein
MGWRDFIETAIEFSYNAALIYILSIVCKNVITNHTSKKRTSVHPMQLLLPSPNDIIEITSVNAMLYILYYAKYLHIRVQSSVWHLPNY